MKKLILIRHAKSSWKYDVKDHQRPLKARGVNDANLVSKALKLFNFTINLVISSDAVRTWTTSEIFTKNLEIDKDKLEFNHDLYDFSGIDLLRVIKSCNENIDTLMLFGHNHAITAFANTYGSEYIDNVPTSGVVIIEFEIEMWCDLKPGKTFKTIFPRDLKD